jgi:N utilization substance protein B
MIEMIFSSEDVDSILEEILPTWYSDKLEIAKTISRTLDKSPNTRLVFDIKTDSVEELSFCKDLFKYSVVDFSVNEKLIESKSLKWDLDRIALMDKLIIAQGVAEAEHFPEIPIKVTLNEYIEISKDYSTPQSKEFINGVLDNIIKEKMELGEVVKFGRGLKEN